MRRYEGGAVLVNSSKDTSGTVSLPAGYKRLAGKQAADINDGLPVTAGLSIGPRDGRVLLKV
jgi:hypothetical protein